MPSKEVKMYTLQYKRAHDLQMLSTTPQNLRGGQNSAPADEVGDLLTLEATAAGEVCHVPSHATPKPTAWEDKACHSTGKNLPGPGERVRQEGADDGRDQAVQGGVVRKVTQQAQEAD